MGSIINFFLGFVLDERKKAFSMGDVRNARGDFDR